MMNNLRFDCLLAKSYVNQVPPEPAPTYARLVPHLRAVECAGMSILEVAGDLILQQLGLPQHPWHSRLNRAMRVACLCHDIGKANDGFQKMVRRLIPPIVQPVRHELLSSLLLCEENGSIRKWAINLLREDMETKNDDSEMLLNCVIGAIGGHHLKLDEGWKKAALALQGGCGSQLAMLFNHPDLVSLFIKELIKEELLFSLVEGDRSYIGNKRMEFNMKGIQWKKRIEADPDWWRFAAALKALLTAADVAGSAMLPEKENIRVWVRETLSHRIRCEEMHEVVNTRLKANVLRPFQEAIGKSRSRITLVEAGCGSGKTVAAFLWAAHHADDKKLFFCYPTTGTATEGFLGYVNETEIEARLIHSRAIVDLEGIAKVTDEDENDHLLRIESLNAWSPKVIVCTVDTVLALVRNNRRGLYNSPAILSGSFVFDEIHAYDNSLITGLVALIRSLPGASFLLMSASLPKNRKEFLLANIPGISKIASPTDLEKIPRYNFERAVHDSAYRIALDTLQLRKRILWVCNTVRRSQRIFELFAGFSRKNYHSGFKYLDRVKKHRAVVSEFSNEACSEGTIAITTQVAQMSLDLDADLLITEIAPIPELIQRLGRLNRRVTPENKGEPRKAIFIEPENAKPYHQKDLELASHWIDALIKEHHQISQEDLARAFHTLSPEENIWLDTRTAWLDSGWLAEPEPVRDIGYSVSIILEEELDLCRQDLREIINRVIPMNYRGNMKAWKEFKGNLIAPPGAIDYNEERGAILL